MPVLVRPEKREESETWRTLTLQVTSPVCTGQVRLHYLATSDLRTPEEILSRGRNLIFEDALTNIQLDDERERQIILREWLGQNGYEVLERSDFARRGIDVREGMWVARKARGEDEEPLLFRFRGGQLLGEGSGEYALLTAHVAALNDMDRLANTTVEPATRQSSLWFDCFSSEELMDSAIRRLGPDIDRMPPGNLLVELRFNIPPGVDISRMSRDEQLEIALQNFAGFRVIDRMNDRAEITEIDNTQLATILTQIFSSGVVSGGAGTAMGRYGVGENFHTVLTAGGGFYAFINNQPLHDSEGTSLGNIDVVRFEDYNNLVAWLRSAYRLVTGR